MTPAFVSRRATSPPDSASARRKCSVETYSSPNSFAISNARSKSLVEVPGDDGIGGGARNLRARVQVGLDFAGERRGVGSELLQDRNDDTVALIQQREQEMVTRELGVAAGAGVALGLLDRLLGLDGQLVKTHGCPFAGG